MAELRVPVEKRPFVGKYVAGATVLFALVGAFVWYIANQIAHPALTVGVSLLATAAYLTILFSMVQSLVKEWFRAAEIDEG